MKRSVLRHWFDRAAAFGRHPKRPGPPASLGGETLTGAATGCIACLLFAVVAGGGPIVLFWSGVAGGLAGSAIGLLLWAGADGHEEEPVRPPQRSRWTVIQTPVPARAERRHPAERNPGRRRRSQ